MVKCSHIKFERGKHSKHKRCFALVLCSVFQVADYAIIMSINQLFVIYIVYPQIVSNHNKYNNTWFVCIHFEIDF